MIQQDDQQAVNEKLFDLGYLWHLKQDELLDLAEDDAEFKQAVCDIQANFKDQYETFFGIHYESAATSHGEIGPAFLDVLNMPRSCPLPDVPPPPGTQFTFDDPLIQKAVESQQRAAESDSRGSGAWPYGCWEEEGYKMHRLVVAVKHSSMPSHWRRHWPWLTEQCRINYSWTGLRIDFVAWGERANVLLQFRGGGGWIGLAEFPNGRCSDEVFLYLKPSYSPSNRAYLLNLLQHELGHTNWLQHSRGGIMNPTINLSDSDWRNDVRWSKLKQQYGGTGSPEILLDGDGPEPPEPPTDVPTHGPNGVFTLDGKLMKIWVSKA